MLTHNLNTSITRSSEIINKANATSTLISQTTIHHIPLRLNSLLLGYNPQSIQSTLLIPYRNEDYTFISSMKFLYSNQQPQHNDHSFLFYNIKDNSMHSAPVIQGGYDVIGKYALDMLSKELDDSQRVYYYKMLIKYFEQCSQAKVPIEVIEKYLSQICKEEVGFQVISNFLYLISKLKDEPCKYAQAIQSVLSKQFLSLFIMYKTWNNNKIRDKVIEMIKVIKGDLREMNLNKDEISALTIDLKNEINVLESLCYHICIREEIKKELRPIFNFSDNK